MKANKSSAVAQAEAYYDSPDADSFYFTIWGGEDIHIGMYKDDNEAIVPASHRNDETLASMLQGIGETSKVLDIGAGYGGAARHLAKTRGCHVTCVNISETQNKLNRELNRKAGLEERVDVVHGDFENIPADDESMDVVWSQDAILHSGNRPRVLDEVKRVLKPGGQFIFTDPMQADDCPEGVLQPILDRIHLETLGSFDFYDRELGRRDFKKVEVKVLTHQLRRHYWRVGEELKANYERLSKGASTTYLDNMIKGLGHWVDGADKGYLAWGVMHYRLAK
ncbi:Methyltransferase type 11 [Parvibaculum lavamentivorans DS-1]|uniref:Methyltransferase type 11 n=1 Tax=Parvibaculum lavamentivorans (strain DS-1 / DSM 13023 / NCIMB 13966) TaxID=402881 RepID=A7HX31_PARL1|nr:class I SAM-dependent methyltransferase [Parvibaculum lavamentivorans]ABS64464.1 Methyltransferase type 11 [Parvibaculum lavamentivorans DS-1]